MVGSANGRSITASMSHFPTKSSRTSTQAVSRPNTTSTTVTTTEMVSVTRNDSTAACDVTASQNACQPPPTACQAMAASGSSTITESHNVATPTRSDTPPDSAAACAFAGLRGASGPMGRTGILGEVSSTKDSVIR